MNYQKGKLRKQSNLSFYLKKTLVINLIKKVKDLDWENYKPPKKETGQYK